MKFVPHEYQQYCVEYIKTHPVSALFLDMGLVRKDSNNSDRSPDLMLDDVSVSKVLVIAPLGLRGIPGQRKFPSGTTCQTLTSLSLWERKGEDGCTEPQCQIYVINRENVKWLVEY
jgi:hypothetical protein